MAEEIFEAIIWQDEEGLNQVRMVINLFNGVEYLHIRKYYLDFEGIFQPAIQGIAIPLSVESTRELFRATAEVISLAESRFFIEEYFGDIIKEIYCK